MRRKIFFCRVTEIPHSLSIESDWRAVVTKKMCSSKSFISFRLSFHFLIHIYCIVCFVYYIVCVCVCVYAILCYVWCSHSLALAHTFFGIFTTYILVRACACVCMYICVCFVSCCVSCVLVNCRIVVCLNVSGYRYVINHITACFSHTLLLLSRFESTMCTCIVYWCTTWFDFVRASFLPQNTYP